MTSGSTRTRFVRRALVPLAVTILALDVLAVLIIRPAVTGLLSLAMTVAGVPGLSLGSLSRVLTAPLALLLLLLVAALVVIACYTAAVLLAAVATEASLADRVRLRATAARWGTGLRPLLGWRIVLLVLSGLPLLPFLHGVSRTGFGEPVVVPQFLIDAVVGSPGGLAIGIIVTAGAIIVGVLFCMVPAIAVLESSSFTVVARASVNVFRAAPLRIVRTLVAAILASLLVSGVLLALVAALCWLIGLGSARGAMIAHSLLTRDAVALGLAAGVTIVIVGTVRIARVVSPPATVRPGLRLPRPVAGALVVALSLSTVAVLGAEALVAVAASTPTDLVVSGHRGDTADAVENTVAALAAGKAAGSQEAEIDVQETSDRQFVVFHDLDLMRLAGVSARVQDLTLAQLTSKPLRVGSHRERASSLHEVLLFARANHVRLLAEVKLHGGESAGYLDRLIEQFTSELPEGSFDLQSLDRGVIDHIERTHPRIRTGLLETVTTGYIGPSSADLILLDQTSYSDLIRAQAALSGKPVFLWIVDGDSEVRYAIDRGVDGVITNDIPDAIRERASASRVPDSAGGWLTRELQQAFGPA